MLGNAPDCSKRSVAQKTLAWFLHAAKLVSIRRVALLTQP